MENFLFDPSWIENAEEKFKKVNDIDPFELGLCIYTDGGGMLGNFNNGGVNLASAGIHGYLFANYASKVGTGIKGFFLTDHGYLINNVASNEQEVAVVGPDGQEGSKVVDSNPSITPIAYFDYKSSIYDGTNNVGEGNAILKALEIVARVKEQLPLKNVHIVSDSKYVLQTLCSIGDYKNRNWVKKSDGKPLANLDMWHSIYEAMQKTLGDKTVHTFMWTQGHKDNFGNIQADKLSSQALVAAVNGHFFESLEVEQAQGRWNDKTEDPHPFLTESEWYCKPTLKDHKSMSGLNVMYIGNHEEDERWGQPNSKDMHAIVHVKHIPEVLLRLRDLTHSVEVELPGFEYEGIYHARIDTILRGDVQSTILAEDGNMVRRNKRAKELCSFNKKPLMSKFHPVRLSKITFETSYGELECRLERVVNDKLLPTECLTEVTEYFYGQDTKAKKPTNKLILGNEPSIKLPIKYMSNKDAPHTVYQPKESQVTISFGITAPRRRVFTGIKDLEPRIFVLTSYEPHVGFRYFTVIKINTGECGIWTNITSNLEEKLNLMSN